MVPRWKGVFSELVNPTSNGIAGLRVSAISKGNNPKDRRDKNTTERRFSELVILSAKELAAKENEALSEVDGYCTYFYTPESRWTSNPMGCTHTYIAN